MKFLIAFLANTMAINSPEADIPCESIHLLNNFDTEAECEAVCIAKTFMKQIDANELDEQQ